MQDGERDLYMESLGLRVLRFSNKEVDRCFFGVCNAIDEIILERIAVEN